MNANKRARTQAAPRAPRGVHNHSWALSHRATEAHAYTNPNPHQSVERRQSRHFRADCAEGRLVPHPRLVTWSVFVRTNVLRGGANRDRPLRATTLTLTLTRVWSGGRAATSGQIVQRGGW